MTNLAEQTELQIRVEFSRHWFVETLKVALNFASKQDIRYYLNGVCIHFKQEEVAIIATDGHRLFYNTHKAFIPENLKDTQYILSRDSLAQLKAMPKLNKNQITADMQCSFEIPEPGGRFINLHDVTGTVYQFEVIDGKFPDYTKVMWSSAPKPTPEIGVNLLYLADLAKLKPLLPKYLGGTIEFKSAKDSMRIVTKNTLSDTDIILYIMPMRI